MSSNAFRGGACLSKKRVCGRRSSGIVCGALQLQSDRGSLALDDGKRTERGIFVQYVLRLGPLDRHVRHAVTACVIVPQIASALIPSASGYITAGAFCF